MPKPRGEEFTVTPYDQSKTIDPRELAQEKEALFEAITREVGKEKKGGRQVMEKAWLLARVAEHSVDDALALGERLNVSADMYRFIFENDGFLVKHAELARKLAAKLQVDIKHIDSPVARRSAEKIVDKWWNEDADAEQVFNRTGKIQDIAHLYTQSGQQLFRQIDAFYAHALSVRSLDRTQKRKLADKTDEVGGNSEQNSEKETRKPLYGVEQGEQLLRDLERSLRGKVLVGDARDILTKFAMAQHRKDPSKVVEIADLLTHKQGHEAHEDLANINRTEFDQKEAKDLAERTMRRVIKTLGVYIDPERIFAAAKDFNIDPNDAALREAVEKKRYRVPSLIEKVSKRLATKKLTAEIKEKMQDSVGLEVEVVWNEEKKEYEVKQKGAKEVKIETVPATEQVKFDLAKCEIKETPKVGKLVDAIDRDGMAHFVVDQSTEAAEVRELEGSKRGEFLEWTYRLNGDNVNVMHYQGFSTISSFLMKTDGGEKKFPNKTPADRDKILNFLKELGATRPGKPMGTPELDADPNFIRSQRGELIEYEIDGVEFLKWGMLKQKMFKVGGKYFWAYQDHDKPLTLSEFFFQSHPNFGATENVSNHLGPSLLPPGALDSVLVFNITDTYMIVAGEKDGKFKTIKQKIEPKKKLEREEKDERKAEVVPRFDLEKCEVKRDQLKGMVLDIIDLNGEVFKFDRVRVGGAPQSWRKGGREVERFYFLNGQGLDVVNIHVTDGTVAVSYFDGKNRVQKNFISISEAEHFLKELGVTRPGKTMTVEEMQADKNIRMSTGIHGVFTYALQDRYNTNFEIVGNVKLFRIGGRYFQVSANGGQLSEILPSVDGQVSQSRELLPFGVLDEIFLFNVTDTYMIVSGKKDGVLVTYKQTLEPTEAPKRELVFEDLPRLVRQRLLLLNLVNKNNLSLGDIEEYYDDYHEEKFPDVEVLLKHATGKAVGIFNQMLKSAPELLMDTMAAVPDDVSPHNIQRILEKIYPEIRAKRLKEEREKEEKVGLWQGVRDLWGGLFGSGRDAAKSLIPQAQAFLQRALEYRLIGGDPKLSPKDQQEILRTREHISRFIVGTNYGTYNKSTGEWKPATYTIPAEGGEPSHEYTLTIPNVSGMTEVVLPAIMGGVLIPGRLKGIVKNKAGIKEEIKLSYTIGMSGETIVPIDSKLGIVDVVYSQGVSELPPALTDVSAKEYEDFVKKFTRAHGEGVREKIGVLPTEEKLFARSLSGKSFVEKVQAIEAYVRDIGYYDFDNREKAGIDREGSVAERLAFMKRRLEEIKIKKPALAQELAAKRYAGVCADFAELTAALMREARIISGVALVLRPQGLSVTTADSHAVATVPCPDSSIPEGYRIVPVDGTPGGVTAAEVKLLSVIQLPTLEKQAEKREQAVAAEVRQAEAQLSKIEQILAGQSPEKISDLKNGDLESTLNVILAHTVRKSHFEAIEAILNTIWYSPVNIRNIDLSKPQDTIALLKFLEVEFLRQRNDEAGDAEKNAHAGSRLLESVGEFAGRMANEKTVGSRADAYALLEKMFALSEKYLNPVERRASTVVIAYLKAKQMVKR